MINHTYKTAQIIFVKVKVKVKFWTFAIAPLT